MTCSNASIFAYYPTISSPESLFGVLKPILHGSITKKGTLLPLGTDNEMRLSSLTGFGIIDSLSVPRQSSLPHFPCNHAVFVYYYDTGCPRMINSHFFSIETY